MVIAGDANERAFPYNLGMSAASEWPNGSLVDEIADVLRERIIEGRYTAHASLSQRGLAKELSVARGVVGEALRVLRRDGLVDIARVGAGTRVAAADRSVSGGEPEHAERAARAHVCATIEALEQISDSGGPKL
jgi:DNA-binding GntR family transcriptional regulator